MKKIFTSIGFLICFLNCVSQFCYPIDLNFGQQGKVSVSSYPNQNQFVSKILVQSDLKIIQIGTTVSNASRSLFVRRYTENGNIDAQYATGGVFLYVSSIQYISIHDAKLQTDGKLLIAGSINGDDGLSDVFLVRLNANGSPDTDFGVNGIKVTSFSFNNDYAASLAIQPDGKILVSGSIYDSRIICEQQINWYSTASLIRFNSNGSVDSSFGTNGVILYASGNNWDLGKDIIVQPDGKILMLSLSGYHCGCEKGYYGGIEWICYRTYFHLQRYYSNGTLDDSFGINGSISDSTFSDYRVFANLQSDGKILVSGFQNIPGQFAFAVKRFQSNGNTDLLFGNNGQSTIKMDISNSDYFNLASTTIQTDGKILLTGNSNQNGISRSFLYRITDKGIPDEVFNLGGLGILESGNAFAYGYPSTLAVQANKILMSGVVSEFGAVSSVIVRIKEIQPIAVSNILASGPLDFCYGDFVSLSTGLVGNYQWYKNDFVIVDSTKSSIAVKQSGVYKLGVQNNDGCGVSSPITVNVSPNPYVNIQWDGLQLKADSGFVKYQWYLNDISIAGATGLIYEPGTQNGVFKVQVTNSTPCSSFSSTFSKVVTALADITVGDTKMKIYPNPAQSRVYIDIPSLSLKKVTIEIFDLSGRKLKTQSIYQGHNDISLSGMVSGIYGLLISDGKNRNLRKLVVIQ